MTLTSNSVPISTRDPRRQAARGPLAGDPGGVARLAGLGQRAVARLLHRPAVRPAVDLAHAHLLAGIWRMVGFG